MKVGDKVIDSSGVLFSITAIDTANSTFTIGTALIDLAQDSDVVHKSGNETVAGVKTITDSSLDFKSTSAEYGVSAGDSSVIFRDKNNLQTFKIYSRVFFSGIDNNLVSFFLTQKVNNTYYTSNGIQLLANTGNKDVILRPILANSNADGLSVSLGASDRRWSKIYGAEYYYGSNNVEFSTKFVTTDTAQTITENKTFTKSVNVKNEDVIRFTDLNSNELGSISVTKVSNGSTSLTLKVATTDTTDTLNSSSFQFFISKTGSKVINPTMSEAIALGRSSNKWADVVTAKVNSLEPSSLSLPSGNVNDVIDISSYLVNLDGTANTYTAPANGWISITMSNSSGVQAYINGLWGHQIVRPTAGGIRFLMPILKDKTVNILIFGGTIDNARFIPCQGNV